MAVVPTDLQRFLRENIEALEDVELLALLGRDPDVPWSAEDAESALGLPEAGLSASLRRMRERGLVEPLDGAGQYVLTRRDKALRARILQLVRVYEKDRYDVIMLISEAAMERVRESMSRAFADAFVLGKKRGQG
jgi:DNA-binding IclR family transcriptional regulator